MKEDSEATLSPNDRTAVEYTQKLIEQRGELSHKHSRDYWRFSTKAELCGQVEADEGFVQGIKDPNMWKEVSRCPSHCVTTPQHIYGLPPVGKRQASNQTQANRNHTRRTIVIGFLR
jgi:hypothetical protein